jgi:acyl dehydratase/NAD(P)-dependent dehydrogenase (short-subunit alcohol dehydrogenase family)
MAAPPCQDERAGVPGRQFDQRDQERFAGLTGDWNPIHVDPVAARRTVAGAPVVHGVHLLLWALDEAAAQAAMRRPTRLRVSFDRFLTVGETATVRVVQDGADRLVLAVEAEGLARCVVHLTFADTPAPTPAIGAAGVIAPGTDAIDRPVDQIDGLTGLVPFARPAAELAAMFPAAARWLDAERIAALGAATRLVGMVCPGLRSIFRGLDAHLVPADMTGEGGIRFLAKPARHGLVTMAVAGGGISGIVTSVLRAAPQRQPAMSDLAGLVPRDAFAGGMAVVVGASRGLGELTAKLLASGGAAVVATWSHGEADARAVAEDIRRAGGRCDLIRYRVGEPTALPAGLIPTHGYFFAAPTIARPASRFFDAARFQELSRFFVDGFWRFAETLRAVSPAVRLFYPSTVYVERWPKGLAEYAMAKAAGEIMCAEMNAQLAPLNVVSARLPRLPTDQTSGLYETEHADPVAALLPLIRTVQGAA